MADLIRDHDWASTPLGPIDAWPADLRFAVVAMLDSPYPTNVLWGESLLQIYNDAFVPTLEGRHPGALGQRTCDCWPEVWAFNEPIYRRVLASGSCVRLVDHPYVIAPAGVAATRYFTTAYAPLRLADGRVAGVLVTSEETTARVLAERRLHRAIEDAHRAERELGHADRMKDEFLATLAHELRNPLAPIRQAARVARSSGVSDEQLRWSTGIIERQVSHMALLLDDLLDVSRITRGILVLRRERVSLAEVIAAAVETSRPAIDTRAHALEVELPAAPVWVDADPLRLGQVLGNLLNNAAKYTDRGGRIRLWTSQPAAGTVAIHVRDSGIGLDAASLTRVFEMFSQVTSSIERSEGGLGIGLALVRGLVEMHGGRVEARSDGPGRGSEFVVQLPLPATTGDVAAPPSRARALPPAPRRILVADDNVDAAESLALLLRLEGHVVEVVHDGAQAVAAAARVRPDVALLDIGMPRLNGYEAAQRLRAIAAGGEPMLLVAVTGWGQRDDRRRASAAGFDHHLTKPVDFERLRELLQARPVEAAAQSSGEVGFSGNRSRMVEWPGVPLSAAKLSEAPTWSAR